jgi:hypothetical protein
MKHYGIAQWIDFARNLAPAPEGAAMSGHLATGCLDCAEDEAFSRRLSDVCRVMVAQEAPLDLVRRARAIFPIPVSEPSRRVFRIPVELIYDSFLAPAPAGLRSTWQVGWQALYRAGDCSLDLRIEPELRSSRAAMIGQVSNHIEPDDSMSDLPVRLRAGKLIVAETRSNRFGEFQMEYEQQRRLHLCVYLDAGTRCIQVALKSVGTEKPAALEHLRLPARPAKRVRGGEDR